MIISIIYQMSYLKSINFSLKFSGQLKKILFSLIFVAEYFESKTTLCAESLNLMALLCTPISLEKYNLF